MMHNFFFVYSKSLVSQNSESKKNNKLNWFSLLLMVNQFLMEDDNVWNTRNSTEQAYWNCLKNFKIFSINDPKTISSYNTLCVYCIIWNRINKSKLREVTFKLSPIKLVKIMDMEIDYRHICSRFLHL